MLATGLSGIMKTVGDKDGNVAPIDWINPMNSLSQDVMLSMFEHRIEGAICQITKVCSWANDSERDALVATRRIDRVDRNLFCVTESGNVTGSPPFECCNQDHMCDAGFDCLNSETNVCVTVNCPEVVGCIDVGVGRGHA